ncbi:hypothetical protein [Streptomyces sp. AM 2-1-1]|uniref:hypothetical protein n=1 Tax=Streptomyces sp. AM 2-1-1 TaxID=3028709 RepID=UPI0023B94C0E|nr:hypothetical protein [Streptomyces sp. AM 2-1-1]WEH41802.1 hypothetical protein PZB77_21180 [Streptomyces sp. AM 2-1-1]
MNPSCTNDDPSLSSPGGRSGTPGAGLRVVTGAQLRQCGLTTAQVSGRCSPRGPWQRLLPGVYLLHTGPADGADRLRAALLYGGRPAGGRRGTDGDAAADGPEGAVVTGVAALALHGFAAAPPVLALTTVDVLVPRTRRLRPAEFVRVVRATLPRDPVVIHGFPVVTAERAVTDVVAGLDDPVAVRLLLAEAVRDGHCEPSALVAGLGAAKLLGRPAVTRAVELLLAEGRSLAEERLYTMVRAHRLPEPVWNVDLRLPGGPHLGSVDAYWPEEAVAVELDTARTSHRRPPRSTSWPAPRGPHRGAEQDADPVAHAVRREQLERLGVTVVRLSAGKPHEAMGQQAGVVRTALRAARDREPAAYVVALPR